MGFFDDIEQEAGGRAMRYRPRPDREVPTAVAHRIVLARTGQAAVFVTGLWAFTAGFEFHVSVYLRDPVPGDSVASFLGALEDEPLEDEFLRLGIAFATGERATNLQPAVTRGRSAGTAGPLLKERFGGGGALTRDRRYWVSPLPPPGPLTFVCEWPAFGIPESRAEIEAQLILDAASQTIDLWS